LYEQVQIHASAMLNINMLYLYRVNENIIGLLGIKHKQLLF